MNSGPAMRLTPEHVRLCHRDVVDAGPVASAEHLTDADYQPAALNLLSGRNGPVWLFAYGSLIWKPEVPHEEMRRAVAKGWHRAFSMQIRRYRATAEQPGYMMCLDPGGNCEGVVLRLPEDGIADLLERLLRRELSRKGGLEAVRWIDVETETGAVKALAFYAGPRLLDYYQPGRPPEEIAHGLARACGHWGSGADYLYNTVTHLEQLGIHDAGLWELQARVADEIERLYGLPAKG